ncbi:peptidyl-dipeptidase Dcp [Streptosporangium becharense]|uniref:Peptidyl-dipeptidase Dcp n=1 Tax=Streptosporangium becharense TaxID=1816182 RepID=A0A7W9IJB4_9ACTN|nr:M3 family metallopeptidase [Streptosporangium becharense]MBB2913859.1 peptidyl-dipeptidase Dcp [Streptosporangium becharense]MBB5821480.1 peptidyl-dipeptidase Dcp [Streptosporangium becharense]
MAENPFFAPSTLPYKLPPFAEIREEHYLPAFERGMADQLREVQEIADNPEPATFANTIEALERSGQILKRTATVFMSIASSDATDGIREIETEVYPKLTKHADAIHLNRPLYARIRQVATDDPEEAWLLEKYRVDFVRAGADLSETEQERLRELNEELTRLATAFAQNLLTASTSSALVVDDVTLLDGLSESAIKSIEKDGRYVLPLLNFTNQPALAELTDRETRRRLYELSVDRAPENFELAVRMATLRAERAALLGYPSHAAYSVADQTAKTTDAVEEMLGKLAGPAVANARREAEALSEQAGFPIEPWDWSFYAEKVRKARYDFDGAELRPYFELDRVLRDGVFHAAGELYGITFAERDDLTGYHPDVRVFEVSEADGSPLGLFVFDPYARPTKRGGAWMNNLVDQSHLFGERPVVMNNLNITKPAEGPTLLTFDEVVTAFHEFGHALHGLFSDVRFPRVSGTEVPRDFVEYPSQVNEMWATWPSVLANFARHHETGEPVPAELLEKMRAAEKFNQGFATVEYLAAALLDWAWHKLAAGEVVEDARAFEQAALERAGIAFELVGPRYRTNYFAHIFSSGVGGYSAGYYSYIWSEVLDAESVEWFKENGGLRRENGDRFRSALLAVGGSRDAMDAFRDFRGRDPRIEPLLERRGLLA